MYVRVYGGGAGGGVGGGGGGAARIALSIGQFPIGLTSEKFYFS